jgi:hypothetical protein
MVPASWRSSLPWRTLYQKSAGAGRSHGASTGPTWIHDGYLPSQESKSVLKKS